MQQLKSENDKETEKKGCESSEVKGARVPDVAGSRASKSHENEDKENI